MITPFRDRQLEVGQKVEVYRNLNTGLFSIRCAKSKLVLAHGSDFVISNPKEKISEASRQRVINEGVKNVHAFIAGVYQGEQNRNDYVFRLKINYNPFKMSHFEHLTEGKVYFTSSEVYNCIDLWKQNISKKDCEIGQSKKAGKYGIQFFISQAIAV